MPSNPFQDQQYLRGEQYRDASKLSARAALHALFSTCTEPWFRWVFDQLELPPQARILEIGCGSGALWAENSERIPAGWQVTLTDLSQGMIDAAKDKLTGVHGSFEFAVADAVQLPFAANQFDAVIANHMLYHVPDLKAALRGIRRVLKAGGCLVAATNGPAHMAELHDAVEDTVSNPPSRWQMEFNLKSGSAHLGRVFKEVERRSFADGLEVTEVEPLVAYVRSMLTLNEAQESTLRERFADEIARDGHVRISKESGFFLAR